MSPRDLLQIQFLKWTENGRIEKTFHVSVNQMRWDTTIILIKNCHISYNLCQNSQETKDIKL